MMKYLFLAGGVLAAGTSLCAVAENTTDHALVNKQNSCNLSEIMVDLNYDTAAVNGCRKINDNHFEFTITPENDPINSSPWYGFKVSANAQKDIKIDLVYSGYKHRYTPKLSSDGKHWNVASDTQFSVAEDSLSMQLKLTVGPKPVWVSAQEIITPDYVNAWLDKLVENTDSLSKKVYGSSVLEHPLTLIETASEGKQKAVFFVGRQHPPEVTGSIAMESFIETVFGRSEVAKQFHACTKVVVAPMMNPDGVKNGHWRSNMHGVDLNRDWSHFEQPETAAIKAEFDRITHDEQLEIVGFLDFHSTWHNLFYTPEYDQLKAPFDYLPNWFDSFSSRLEARGLNSSLLIKPSAKGTPGTSRTFTLLEYGIPGVTFEIADDADRAYAKALGEEGAMAFMATISAMCAK